MLTLVVQVEQSFECLCVCMSRQIYIQDCLLYRKSSGKQLHNNFKNCITIITKNTSELGRGCNAANSPLVTKGCATFPIKITPSRAPSPKHNYLPHPRTHLTNHPKVHPYPISRFATMHRTEKQTNRWLEGIFSDYDC